jgi:transposase
LIGSARQIAVYAYGEPVDMRKSFNTLAALVVGLGKELLSGHYFLFVSRDRKRAKVLYFDGTGLCLLAKRLDKGRFAPIYERAQQGVLQMTLPELALFLEGSAAVGRIELSPPLLTLADLSPRWPKKKSDRLEEKFDR